MIYQSGTLTDHYKKEKLLFLEILEIFPYITRKDFAIMFPHLERDERGIVRSELLKMRAICTDTMRERFALTADRLKIEDPGLKKVLAVFVKLVPRIIDLHADHTPYVLFFTAENHDGDRLGYGLVYCVEGNETFISHMLKSLAIEEPYSAQNIIILDKVEQLSAFRNTPNIRQVYVVDDNLRIKSFKPDTKED